MRADTLAADFFPWPYGKIRAPNGLNVEMTYLRRPECEKENSPGSFSPRNERRSGNSKNDLSNSCGVS
jgi:hypothetical protein